MLSRRAILKNLPEILHSISHPSSLKLSEGIVSWYRKGLTHPQKLTAAHRTLPFGTKVRMTRKDYTVVVRINDRGPQNPEWEFDISEGAAEALRIKSLGIAKVQWEIIG